MKEKPKISVYWAASCGGCEIAVLNLHERIFDIDSHFDFMFCPCLLDTKKKDIEALPDGSIAITLFNGAIRTEDNEEMAHLMRKKSALLIAFGSCSTEGCVVGLGNLYSSKDFFHTIYVDNPSVHNPSQVIPGTQTNTAEGTLHLPKFLNNVIPLSDVVDVDYFIPGCPPESRQIWNVVDLLIKGEPLPPKGSVIGAGKSSVCDECKRKKANKKIEQFFRTYEIIPDRENCLLEQGLICMGVATRDGCGALCPEVNMPCTGCYGAPDGVFDQGAKMISTLGSILDIGDTRGMSEDEIAHTIDDIIDSIPDIAGTVNKYSMAHSPLTRNRTCRKYQ